MEAMPAPLPRRGSPIAIVFGLLKYSLVSYMPLAAEDYKLVMAHWACAAAWQDAKCCNQLRSTDRQHA